MGHLEYLADGRNNFIKSGQEEGRSIPVFWVLVGVTAGGVIAYLYLTQQPEYQPVAVSSLKTPSEPEPVNKRPSAKQPASLLASAASPGPSKPPVTFNRPPNYTDYFDQNAYLIDRYNQPFRNEVIGFYLEER